ncbi:NfeD family protein [Bacillus sp. UNCCL81]|uniref:NfeD family protein n=1 Tax=Bacillus sp. UNCCL81 TaxID=1502755 RepID=UPI0008E7BA78|nr:NfeD family protein [Bacillus sp. UNCCL81]SFD23776.1 Membrane protein implicated in regulation of membrane protease activity [Bacillus sp. UNCCL81]
MVAISLFVIGVLLIIIEMFSLTFVFLWIGIASILASVVNYFTGSNTFTFIVFVISALILWLSTKKFAKKIHQHKTIENGVYALVGKEVVVASVEINDDTVGTTKVYGDEWTIRSTEPLILNEKVIVTNIEGATLYVKNN